MALIKCEECGKDVSTKAKVCQNCGAVVQDSSGCITAFLSAAIVILIFVGFINLINDTKNSDTSLNSRNISGNADELTKSILLDLEKIPISEFEDNLRLYNILLKIIAVQRNLRLA